MVAQDARGSLHVPGPLCVFAKLCNSCDFNYIRLSVLSPLPTVITLVHSKVSSAIGPARNVGWCPDSSHLVSRRVLPNSLGIYAHFLGHSPERHAPAT